MGVSISLSRPLPVGIAFISQHFGEHPEWYRQYGYAGHNGTDWPAVKGTPATPFDEGVVIFAGWNDQGYGNLVKIEHAWGVSRYAHFDQVIAVVGQRVFTTTQIGTVGCTGNSTGDHLHGEIEIKGDRNPAYGNRTDLMKFANWA